MIDTELYYQQYDNLLIQLEEARHNNDMNAVQSLEKRIAIFERIIERKEAEDHAFEENNQE